MEGSRTFHNRIAPNIIYTLYFYDKWRKFWSLLEIAGQTLKHVVVSHIDHEQSLFLCACHPYHLDINIVTTKQTRQLITTIYLSSCCLSSHSVVKSTDRETYSAMARQTIWAYYRCFSHWPNRRFLPLSEPAITIRISNSHLRYTFCYWIGWRKNVCTSISNSLIN